MPEDVKPVGTLKPYNPNSTGTVKPVGKLRPFGQIETGAMQDFGSDKLLEQSNDNSDEIINNLKTDNDNEKQVLKNLALKVNEGKAKHEDLTDAILIFQGQHPNQGGEKNYYIEDKNGVHIPRALGKGEKASKNVVSTFNDSNWYEDLGNSFMAGAEKLGASILRTPAFAYDVASETGEDLLFKMNPELKPIYEKAGLSKGTPSEQMSRSLGLPEENTWAKALEDKAKENKATIIQKYDKGITDYISQGDYGKAIASIGNSIAESLPVTISLVAGNMAGLGATGSTLVGTGVFGAEKKQELKEEGSTISEGKQNLVALGSGFAEGLFEQFGITKLGSVFKKALVDSGEKEAKRILLSGFKEVYRPTLSKLGITSEEALGEAATQFTQNALEKYSGNKPDLDLSQGVADAFIVGGVMGGGFSLAGSNVDEVQKRKVEKLNEQNKVVFDVVTKGKEAIDAFKADIYNGVRTKKISQTDADKAIVKISAYNDYNQMLTGYELNDATKQELFDLSFKKQELVNSLVEGIKGKNLEDMNPIEQAKYKATEKIAKDLQDKITGIVTGLEVIKDGNVSDKTIDKVIKDSELPQKDSEKTPKLSDVQKALINKYKKQKEEVSKKEYPKHELSYEETPVDQFNKLHPREIHRVLSEHLDKQEGNSTTGTVLKIPYDSGKNSIFTVEMGDGKEIQFASSRIREDEWKNGHLMHAADNSIMKKEGEYMTIDRDKLENKPVALKLYTIENDGRKKNVIKIYNPENGKFIAWAKETMRGKNDVTHKEINGKGGLIDIEKTIEPPINPSNEGGVTVTPKTPIKPQPKADKSVQVPTKDEFVASQIEALKNDPDTSFDESLEKDGFYERHFTKQYEKQYGKNESADTSKQEKSETRDTEKTDGEGEDKGKEIKLRTGVKRLLQKIKSPARRKAIQWEVTTPYHTVLQYFAGKGTIASAAIGELYGKKRNDKGELMSQEEKFKRNPYLTSAEKTKKGTESLDALAHTLWQDNRSQTPNATSEDYKNALEEALQSHLTRNAMADDLNKAMEEGTQVQRFENEEAMNKYYEQMEAYENEGNAIVDNLEMYSDAYLEKLANDQAEFEKWEKENDAEIRNDIQDDVESALRKIKEQDEEDNKDTFQKSKELIYAEGQLAKAEAELKASKKAFDAKRKELGNEINNDQEDLFGERKSEEGSGLFDERVDMNAYEGVIAPFKDRYDSAVKAFNKAKDKVSELEGSEDSQTSLFQNKALKAKKEAIEKIVNHLRKALSKDIKIVYDTKLKAAGKWSPKTRTITINPKFAGKDTPIHEVGHILIDAMGGTTNRVIKAAIKQLEGTPLWKETAKAYPLSDDYTIDDLGKEVLAEAIGREGAGIFDTVAEQSKFKQYLNYIFDWLKRNLGLEKNIAKNLAKQIISGIGTKKLGEIGGKDQFQKNKQDEINELQNDLNSIDEQLENEEDEDVIEALEETRNIILDKIEALENGIVNSVERVSVIDNLDIEKATLPELINAYVTLEKEAQELTEQEGEKHYADTEKINKLKDKIGYILDNTRKEDLQKKWGKEINELANKRDLSWREVWFRTMGHITNEFPAIQELYNEFNQVNLDKEKETYSRKTALDKKAKAVIKEVNKKLGVKDAALGLMTSNSAKYFNYLENNGKYLTLAEAKAKGLSKAQIEYLEAVRELVKEKNKLAGKETNDLEVIKIDKGFKEAFKDDGFMTAMSLYMGGGNNVDTKVTYANPLTGKLETVPYKDAQKAILAYSDKGVKEKAVALAKLLSISYKAKKGAYRSDKNINYNGILTSKFDQPYDKVAGYSKDYHNAAMQLIDDVAHVKHMNKIVPLANAVELFYQKLGASKVDGKEQMQYGNVLEFMRHWKNEQIYQKTLQTDPTIDAAAKFLRSMTSLTVMSFAVPANIMNVTIGNYNSIRKEGWTTWVKGQKELFAGDKHRAGFGFVGKKANDINNKYQIVKSDLDSNPKNHIGKWFDQLAFAGTRFGEYQIQLSLALGLMKDADLMDSFTYKNGELVLKDGINEKEFEKKISEIKDKVSDIQGKYDPKDRRNIARYELGKAGLQFKNWIPDWTHERFASEYIDSKGVLHRGSTRALSSQAIKEMKADIATYGKFMAIFKGETQAAKNWRSNLNGLLFLTSLYIFKNSGDDDDKKRRETLSLQNAFEQVMFVYDPSQAKYLLKSPIASWGIIDKFLTIAENVVDGNPEKAGKTAKKLIPYNKLYDDVNYLTGNDKK